MQKKTVRQREEELQSLLDTPEGRTELESLESLYASVSGRVRAEGETLVSYILDREREKGLVVD